MPEINNVFPPTPPLPPLPPISNYTQSPPTIAGQIGLGVLQGGLNGLNFLTDLGIGLLNTPAALVNSQIDVISFGMLPDRVHVPYIPMWDWARGLAVDEGGTPGGWDDMHGWGKFAWNIPFLAGLGAWELSGTALGETSVSQLPKFIYNEAKGCFTREAAQVAKGESVIGPRNTYRQFAKEKGAHFLDVTDDAWTWELNKKYLDEVIARGDDVLFAGKFNPELLASHPESALAKEIEYLTSHGYKWTVDLLKLTKN